MTTPLRRRHRGAQPHRQAQALIDQAIAARRPATAIAAALPLALAEAWLTHQGWRRANGGWTRNDRPTLSRIGAVRATLHDQEHIPR
jgi:hypothetical protein